MSYELFLIRISESLGKIADSLEKLANICETKDPKALTLHFKMVDSLDDDDENDEKRDPSDGPFVVQEPEETDDFADLSIFDSEDFEQ